MKHIRCIKVIHQNGEPATQEGDNIIWGRGQHQVLEIAQPGHVLDGLRGNTIDLSYSIGFNDYTHTECLGPVADDEISIYETGERIKLNQQELAS